MYVYSLVKIVRNDFIIDMRETVLHCKLATRTRISEIKIKIYAMMRVSKLLIFLKIPHAENWSLILYRTHFFRRLINLCRHLSLAFATSIPGRKPRFHRSKFKKSSLPRVHFYYTKWFVQNTRYWLTVSRKFRFIANMWLPVKAISFRNTSCMNNSVWVMINKIPSIHSIRYSKL